MSNKLIINRPHERLNIWQESMDLVEDIYRITSTFPRTEQFALTSQMRRAVVSVPSNIAEGAARDSDKEFLRYLSIARGSLAEIETQIQIAHRLGYDIDQKRLLLLANGIFAKITGLMKTLKRDLSN
jgi:four helix bundle protein